MSKSKNIALTQTNTRPATRRPIKDVVGDADSLGILFMTENWLEECRELSGAPKEYKNEYAVWYSAEVMEVKIGKHSLSVIRPYSFYNTNQTVGAGSVDIEPEDFALLTETYNTLTDDYYNNIAETENALNYKAQMEKSILVKYAYNYYGSLEEFRDQATEEFTVDVEEHRKTLDEEALVIFNLELTTEATERELQSYMELIAVDKLVEDGIIIKTSDKLTDEELKDVEDNNKLVIYWATSHMNNFHSHPRGINSFSGTVGGSSGDLDSSFLETWDEATHSYLPSTASNSSAGIVYPFSSEFLDHPMPICAGVIQQIKGKSKLIFNELRRWHSVEFGDYTYARTPLVTYVKGLHEDAPEIPLLQTLLGKEVEDVQEPNEYVAFMGPVVTDYTEELFQIFLDNPIETLFDIDSSRVSGFTAVDVNDKTYPKKYFKKKKMALEWVESFVGITKKLKKLSVLNLNKAIDIVLLKTFFNPNVDCSKELDLMHRVFTMYDLDIFELATEFKGLKDSPRRTEIVNIIEGFIKLNNVFLYQFKKLKELKIPLEDVVKMSKDEISVKVRESYKTSYTTDTPNAATNWPVEDFVLEECLLSLDITKPAHNVHSTLLWRYKEAINNLYKIEQVDRWKFWEACEALDVDITTFSDPLQVQHIQFEIDAIKNWKLSRAETQNLIKSGHTYDELIWLSEVELEKLLISSRSKGLITFQKKKINHTQQATFLRNECQVFTVEVNKILYGVHVEPAKEAVNNAFNKNIKDKLVEEIPNIKDPQYIIDTLSDLGFNIIDFIRHAKVEDIVNRVFELDTNTRALLRDEVIPYTDSVTVPLTYTPQELAELTVIDVKYNTDPVTSEDIGVHLENINYVVASNLLLEWGITKYSTVVNGNILEVSLNSTNIGKAFTDFFIDTMFPSFSAEEICTIINNMNRIGVGSVELLEMNDKTSDEYIEPLLNLDIDDLTLAKMLKEDKDWKEIVKSNRLEENYTKPPYMTNKMWYKEVDGKVIPITKEAYDSLCKKLCVVKEIMITDKKLTAITNANFKVSLTKGSKTKVGDVLHPVIK